MNSTKAKVAAVAALLVFSGCSGTSEPAAGPADGATASSTSTATAASTTSSSSSTLSPTASTSPTLGSTASSASASATEATTTEACRQVVADQQAALEAVAEYVQHPLTGDVSVAGLEVARDKLRDDLSDVPAAMQTHLRTQINILSKLIEDLRTRNIKNVDVGKFRDAAQQVASMCQTNR